MIARYAASITTAGIVTLGLLLVMGRLIVTGPPVVTDHGAVRWNPFVVERRPPPEIETNDSLPPRDPPAAPPERPQQTLDGGTGGPLVIRDAHPPTIDTGFTRAAFGMADGDLMPVTRVQPVYPPAAARRNLEGYVIVRFVVTQRGAVEDIEIVEASHDVFVRPAIEAAGRFRYRPRVVNGEAVRVSGVKNLFRFVLDDRNAR